MRVLSIDVGSKNLALCVLDCQPESRPAIREWVVTAVDGTGPAGVVATMARLGAAEWLGEGDEVVIEKQPPKNSAMKELEHYLHMFFCMKGFGVHIQDARAKLNWGATTPHWPAGDIPEWTYGVRKRLSVAVMRGWLEAHGDEASRQVFEASKKKDDLGDCFLQGAAYWFMVRKTMQSRRAEQPSRKVVARKPSDKAMASGRFTPSGTKWMMIQRLGPADATPEAVTKSLGERGADVTKLRKSVLKHFETIEMFTEKCFGKK